MNLKFSKIQDVSKMPPPPKKNQLSVEVGGGQWRRSVEDGSGGRWRLVADIDGDWWWRSVEVRGRRSVEVEGGGD